MTEYAKIEGEDLVIRIPKADLPHAAYLGLEYFNIGPLTKLDWDALAEDIVSELNVDDEDGTTLVHRALDRALINAGENGSAAIPY